MMTMSEEDGYRYYRFVGHRQTGTATKAKVFHFARITMLGHKDSDKSLCFTLPGKKIIKLW
jgi:hypothetical protein